MVMLANFPMVSQRTTVTSDGRPSENALYDCVSASIGADILWLEDKSQWDETINPDKLKDAAYGEAYSNAGTSASAYVSIVKSMGYTLSMQEKPDPVQTVALARQLLAQNKPAIFTELDPYVDTNLPQYSNWTHVCVWIGDDGAGLTAMDPFIAKPVYKSYSTWAQLLREYQLWTVERSAVMLPNGWKDDGKTLTAPNGVPLVLGFRAHVLPLLQSGTWAEDDYPTKPQYYMPVLEASNADLGDGDQIMTRRHMLGYPHNPTGSAAHLKNTVIEEFVGSELEHTRQQYADIYDAYQKLKAQGGQPQPPTQILTDMQQIEAIAVKYRAS